VLLVNVGGNIGRDVTMFRKAFPDLAGRVILQDLPAIIESGLKEELSGLGIKAIAHDFFTPQPVKGARAYYLHHILRTCLLFLTLRPSSRLIDGLDLH